MTVKFFVSTAFIKKGSPKNKPDLKNLLTYAYRAPQNRQFHQYQSKAHRGLTNLSMT